MEPHPDVGPAEAAVASVSASEKIVVEVDPNPPPRYSNEEMRGLVRVEEIRLERTKLRLAGLTIVVFGAMVVGTCQIMCG